MTTLSPTKTGNGISPTGNLVQKAGLDLLDQVQDQRYGQKQDGNGPAAQRKLCIRASPLLVSTCFQATTMALVRMAGTLTSGSPTVQATPGPRDRAPCMVNTPTVLVGVRTTRRRPIR